MRALFVPRLTGLPMASAPRVPGDPTDLPGDVAAAMQGDML